MKNEDPIEALFQKSSSAIEQEKPRELVWNRIENKLKPPKEQPLKKFISSIWFSAAVFALIAVPYFVLLVENLNRENVIDSIQMTTIKQDIKTPNQPEIVQVIPNTSSSKLPEVQPEVKNEIYVALPKLDNINLEEAISEKKLKEKTIILDSIDEKNSYVVLRKAHQIKGDSLESNHSADTVLIAVAAAPTQSKVAKITSSPVMEELKDELMIEISSELQLLPRKLIIKEEVIRTSFQLIKKQNDEIVFENKSIQIIFKKENNHLRMYSNSQHLDNRVVKILEVNKEKIFSYYTK